MALASYADADNEYLARMRNLVSVGDDGMFSIDLAKFAFFNFWDRRMFSDRFVDTFGEPRAPADPITARHYQIAAALQRVFEEVMTALLARLHEMTGLDDVVVSGGSFMNSVFNGKIESSLRSSRALHRGLPGRLGNIDRRRAVHSRAAHRTAAHRVSPPQHNYFGREYSDEECWTVATAYRLPAVRVTDPSRAAAEDLVDGKLIGWFQGRSEFGQRALGNRSILVDPRREDAKDLVNSAVKFRESFRPFAPAILADRVDDYFDCPPGTEVPFMERVFMFKPERRDEVPAVVPRRRLGPPRDGRSDSPPLPGPDRAFRRGDGRAHRAQHQLQPERRTDGRLAGRTPSGRSTRAGSTSCTSATSGSRSRSRSDGRAAGRGSSVGAVTRQDVDRPTDGGPT